MERSKTMVEAGLELEVAWRDLVVKILREVRADWNRRWIGPLYVDALLRWYGAVARLETWRKQFR